MTADKAIRSIWAPNRIMALAAPLLLAAAVDPRTPGGLPLHPARTVTIDTTTGTFIALDVTPDAQALVFDLLGDLYVLPAAGGRARQVTTGLAYDTQPVVSPDGQRIAFISDRSGADDVWLARLDGSHPRQVTFSDDDTVLVQPAWSADGRAVYASRYRADLNSYELWRYPLAGGAELIAPVRENDAMPRSTWRSTLGAVFSRDGRWLYYARRVGGLDFDAVNAWSIMRRDLATGTEQALVTGSGARGAERETYFAPAISPDGDTLAYATRSNGRTLLRLRNLATGQDRELATLDPDLLQASSWQGLVPRYVFAPDGHSLIVSRRGGIERIAFDGRTKPIPFAAHMRVALGPSTSVPIREEGGAIVARLIQAPVSSPDGRRLAFGALGSVWTQPLTSDARSVKISGTLAASQPGWSPDGQRIAFVSWDESGGGQIWSAPADGSAPPRQLTRIPAFAGEVARVAAAGGLVGMGSHGELPGIGIHYEMQAHVMGGMAPMTVLHAATAGSGEVIGRLGDLGTIEPGKFADLVILDADPLSDIANTLALAQVMRGGTLYDANSLAELWPRTTSPPSPWYVPGRPASWLPVLDTAAGSDPDVDRPAQSNEGWVQRLYRCRAAPRFRAGRRRQAAIGARSR